MSRLLHDAFVADATKVRTALGEMDVSHFDMQVSISGRTLDGADECKIEYRLEAGYDHTVKGDSVEACLAELQRRLGWHKEHMPLALAKPRTKEREQAAKDAWNYEASIEPPTTNDF